MAEFAYGPTGHNANYGPVRNPWSVDHITGGSSSGSGSAVAARLTFAALGSHTRGFVPVPAPFFGGDRVIKPPGPRRPGAPPPLAPAARPGGLPVAHPAGCVQ